MGTVKQTPNNIAADEWVSVSTCAVMLGVSKQTVYNMIARGELPSKRYKRGRMDGLLVYCNKVSK